MVAETAHIFLTRAEDAPREEARAEPGQNAAARLDSLVARARAGDAAAFEQLMAATERKVVATAWRLLGDREDARDAAQETYLRVYKYLGRFRAGEDFQAWLYKITVNVCRDAARRRGGGERLARLSVDEVSAASSGASVGPEAERAALVSQQREMLRRALATLPEKERAAVVLRDVEGLSTEEVARILNSRPVTVRSQVSSARTKLKAYCDRLLQRKGVA